MHDTHAAIAVAHRFQGARLAQAIDVVDQVDAGGQRFAHHGRFIGIDGERLAAIAQGVNGGHDPVQLLFQRQRRTAGAARLTAYVDDIDAISDHLLRMRQGKFE